MKWKFNEAELSDLVSKQREIFKKAFEFLKPEGFIAYITCSVLQEENEKQIDFFTSHYPVELIKNPFASFPKKGGMDGFFCALFRAHGDI